MKPGQIFTLILLALCALLSQCSNKNNYVEEVSDPKVFKQLLRTRTNVMVLFMKSRGSTGPIYRLFSEVAREIRGIGTMVSVDCSGAGQKLCRQMKAAPEPHLMHHFKDGKFHVVYDRPETIRSLVRFMNDPTGDPPWEEDENSKDVAHLDGPKSLVKLLKKHKRALVMFYAPWCVYCKQMKPEYSAAATMVKNDGLGVLAAVDVVRTENAGLRTKYNITGFPTVHYFKNGEITATYDGENKQDKIVAFMKNPKAVPAKAQEAPWADEPSDVHHLSDDNFDQFIQDHSSTVVMFYAPWCGHCKNLKPEWVKAAEAASKQKIPAVLAAVDTTKETALGERFKVKGFPTIKFFKDGEFAFDTPNIRDSKKILEFLRDPKEPPPAPPPEPAWADSPSEVVHLTDETFKPQLRSKRHALVMFYAPWCGHCKAAKPEFESAAEQLKDEPRMALAAVNCVEHTAVCKHYEVRGYPTFKYFKYHKQAVQDYDGGRKTADFVSFLTNLEPDSLVRSDTVEVTPTAAPQPAVNKDQPQQQPVEVKPKVSDGPTDVPNYPGWDKVLHLTDENYKQFFSQHKHLLVFFHAKWCSHCADLKPVFGEIATTHDSSLGTLAACDADVSPLFVDELLVQSLPTLSYVRNGRLFTTYKSERTAAMIRAFVKKMKTVEKKDEL